MPDLPISSSGRSSKRYTFLSIGSSNGPMEHHDAMDDNVQHIKSAASHIEDEKGQLSPIEYPRELDIDLEARGEREGYVLDVNVLKALTPKWQDYQLAEDGRTVLIPQPTLDENDPLNWSWWKKHTVLLLIAWAAFLPDYGSATGAVTLIPQSKVWGISPDEVNHSQAGNVFMLGAAGPIIVALSAYFGRLPVLFWFIFHSIWTAAGCAGSKTFNAFFTFRVLNGFFSTVAQGGGVMFIKDMFYVHERARKINVWATFFILSPYFGPLIAAFIITTQDWDVPFWVFTAMVGLCFILIILFGQETFYNRKIPPELRPRRAPGIGGQLSRLIGIEQWRTRHQRSSFKQACLRPLIVLLKPTVFLSCTFYLFTFAWAVGINTTLAMFVTPLYNFGPKQIGFYYFTPVVAASLGEIVGHWLHDRLARLLTRLNPEHKLEPEYRLMAISIAMPFVIAGLAVVGFALENAWHYMLTALGWGMYVFGMMITSVALTSYNLDCYPEGAGETGAWLNFARTTGGFIISYFQVDWANAMGTKKSFGIQAGVCAVAYGVIVVLQVWGKRLRERSGPLAFKTD